MQGQNKDMPRGERTCLTKTSDKSCSLRTTIPKGIVGNFDLKEGDHLNWLIKPSPNGKDLIIVVQPEHARKTTEVKR